MSLCPELAIAVSSFKVVLLVLDLIIQGIKSFVSWHSFGKVLYCELINSQLNLNEFFEVQLWVQ